MGVVAALLQETWRALPAKHQPTYRDQTELESVVTDLRQRPPLVKAAEIDSLRDQLAGAGRGEAFVLIGGDCAESFKESTKDQLRMKIRTIVEMASVLTFGAALPVVKIGRIAGQYAKPRSSQTETCGDITLPSYLGDAINSVEFSAQAREHDPQRLLEMYRLSAASLNVIKNFAQDSRSGEAEIFSAHEALILEYEAALTRRDSATKNLYGTSGHFLWIGERTRGLGEAHVELLSNINNPIGVKLGPSTQPEEIKGLLDRLNPLGEEGRLVFMVRMGAENIRDALPPLIETVKADGHPVTWVSDPMHGNTIVSTHGYKTRDFDTIVSELDSFFRIHREHGTIPAGIHVEMTGADVTEVLGGAQGLDDHSLIQRYETLVDPRLNHQQSLEIAFQVAQLAGTRQIDSVS